MSDTMIMPRKLAVIPTIQEGVIIGVKNIGPILVNILLWALTIWIPYLNVGTTIGLSAGIVSKASKGEIIPIAEIFDPKYRKYMGECFITAGLIGIGVTVGLIFLIIPGIVISLAWSLAILLVVDQGKNPTEAITMSNNCTYGYKWKMVGIYLLVNVLFSIIQAILALIISGAAGFDFLVMMREPLSFPIYFIVNLVVSLFSFLVSIGLQASIYKQLTA